jgi:hypothetical protein
MKNIQTFVGTIICMAATAFAATASAQTETQGVVTVAHIQGAARYSSGDSVWHTLSVGKTLGQNDVIETAADSTVDLILSDKAVRINQSDSAGSLIGGSINVAGLPIKPLQGSGQAAPQQNIVRVEADSVLSIDKFTYSQTGAETVTDTELNLQKGKALANVKKVSADSQFIVKMPVGVAGIRGSQVAFDSDGGATVLEGSAVLSVVINGVVTTVTLTEGESYDPTTQTTVNLAQTDPTAFADAKQNATQILTSVNNSVTGGTVTINNTGSVTTVYISPDSGSTVTSNSGS